MPILAYIQGCLRFVWELLNGGRLAAEQRLVTIRQQDIGPYVQTGESLQVLDLANGRLRPQFILLEAAGYQVYGIDLANRAQLTFTDVLYKLARWLYRRRLPDASSKGRGILVCGDAGALPFADGSFDLVTSVAAFEHFLNVPQVVRELHRVLRPGGLSWIAIHLFTSPSGGHNLGFTGIPLRAVPPGVEPWDHLRKRRLPLSVPLNKWRRNQYVNEFARRFQIVKQYCDLREGGEWLTPDLEAELSGYSRDELTCGAYIVVARKLP